MHISNVTLWKWVRQGKLSVVRLSPRKVYVKKEELERFIRDGETEQTFGVAEEMRVARR